MDHRDLIEDRSGARHRKPAESARSQVVAALRTEDSFVALRRVTIRLLDEARSRTEICALLADFRVGLSETHDDAVMRVLDLLTGWGDPNPCIDVGLTALSPAAVPPSTT